MNIALWIVQGLLAAMFLYVGGLKTFAYEKFQKMSKNPEGSGISRGLTTFIGICEIAGGIGLILPMATGVAPVLTPVAAIALGVVMILAAGFHARRKEPVMIPVVLLAMCAAVAFGRI